MKNRFSNRFFGADLTLIIDMNPIASKKSNSILCPYENECVLNSNLNEKPRTNERQSTILSIEPVVIRVEGKVIEKKETQPIAFANARVTAYGIVLIGYPND